MFDLDRFVADCRAAVAAEPTHKAAREAVARSEWDPETLRERAFDLDRARRLFEDANAGLS